MSIALIFFGACLGCSVVYHLISIACAIRWRKSAIIAGPTPPVSILKPLRGDDPDQLESFGTFCEQEYGPYQIVFGALDPADSGLNAASSLREAHPNADIAIVAGGEAFGLNRKVCNLALMLPHAKHDLLVLCDSDMRVAPGYLRRIAAPFSDPTVGLVTCPYRGYSPWGLASCLEALGIGADFMPSVFVAYYLWGVRPAFGSTIVLTKQILAEIGGFEALADELADDYRLAEAVNRLGKRVVLSDYVVDDVLGSESFRDMWSRRLRWAKTSRSMRPGPYSGAFITFTLPLALLFGAAAWYSWIGWATAAACYAARCFAAIWIATTCTRDPNITRYFALLPISDLVSAALWVCSFFGSNIEWRGERFRIMAGGRLVPVIDDPIRHAASTNSP